MTRGVMPPYEDDRGAEQHPAWVLIGAYRVQSSPPGAVLFDSDVRHQHYVTVQISRAYRQRDLHRDWIHSRERIIDIAMSEAQWASFVSSINSGGVPATLTFDATQDDPHVPEMPYAPRLAVSLDEVRNTAAEAEAKVQDAFTAYKEHKTAANLRDLEIAIGHLTPNMTFAAQSLSEHAENVVTRARADIEAFVVQKAAQLGLEPGELGKMPPLLSESVEPQDEGG